MENNNQNTQQENLQPKPKATELLEKMIDLIEKNNAEIEKCNDEMNDLTLQLDEFEIDKFKLKKSIDDFDEILTKEHQSRKEFLEKIPKSFDVQLSPNNLALIEKINRQSYFIRTFVYLSIGFLIFGLANFIFVTKTHVAWYKESIKSRQEILLDYEKAGKTIVSLKYLNELKKQDKMLEQFIIQKPKEAAPLKLFREGYNAK